MDFHTRTQRLWQHTCCQTRYWSAARLCDRCGAHATSVVVGVSTADAMAHPHFLEQLPIDTKATPPAEATADLPGRASVSPCEQAPPGARSVLDPGSHIAHSRRVRQANEEERTASRPAASLHPDLERALLSVVWLLSGFVCTSMGIGAFVEFERANYVRSLTYAISASAAPIAVIASAIEGWLKHGPRKR